MPQTIRGRRFNPIPTHVGLVLEEMILGPGFSLGTLFLSLSLLDTHMLFNHYWSYISKILAFDSVVK